MVSPEKITAGWLIDGLHATYGTGRMPTGWEFPGLALEPGRDPIPQLGRQLAEPRLGLPMKRAVREAIADTSLYRFERGFAEAVMLGLVRLVDYFGSPQAVLSLVVKAERGEFSLASEELQLRTAIVGARQERDIRERFERALRQPASAPPDLILPFLRAEFEEAPAQWLDVARARLPDIDILIKDGLNPLPLILGALCDDGRAEVIHRGLAHGVPEDHAAVLDRLLGEHGEPKAELVMRPADGVGERAADLRLDLYLMPLSLEDLRNLRPREDVSEGTGVEIEARVSGVDSEWERALTDRAKVRELEDMAA